MFEYIKDPVISDKIKQHYSLWEQSRDNSVRIRHTHVSNARQILKDLGFNEFDDFQIRQGQIRFTKKEDMGLAMMSGLTELLDV